ncbi:hypothetical protein BGX27_006700 [Mortierella sp. AM989]|nr:hypothetical protein BGX27_006700 [Mortierella sp. AM989]
MDSHGLEYSMRNTSCKTCESFIHHNVMAGHYIRNIVQGYLVEQKRPDFLQPVDADGGHPCQEDFNSSIEKTGSNNTSSITPAKFKSGTAQAPRKRTPANDTPPRPSPTRQSKKRKAIEEDE